MTRGLLGTGCKIILISKGHYPHTRPIACHFLPVTDKLTTPLFLIKELLEIMKKYRTAILAIGFLLLAGGVLIIPSGAKVINGDNAAAPAIGSTIADFKAPDLNGNTQALSSLKGTNGTVIIFVSAQCPVVRAYNERMERLAEDYKGKGVNVIAINANSTETLEMMKAHAADNKFSFAMLQDKGNRIADALGAQVTPEAFVLDANNKLVYHGRIDNSKNTASITATDLRDALDAMLAGKPVVKTEASAFGCSIKRA